MFLCGIQSDFGMDENGMAPPSKATDMLRKAFESVQFIQAHGDDDTDQSRTLNNIEYSKRAGSRRRLFFGHRASNWRLLK
jgi:hypothetical protein